MKKIISLIFISLITLSLNAFASETIKVACVGDSITFGFGIKNETDKYPHQLGLILGDVFEVKNFGLSGTTLLTNGNRPYIKKPIYKEALAFEPMIVIIKLGTNDSKMDNWGHIKEFEADLNALIDSFEKLKTNPIVYLCTPAAAYLTGDKINEDRIVEGVIPVIEKVAKDRDLVIIDLHKVLSGKPEMFPDRIHPNAAGAKLMAETISKVILAEDDAE